MRNNQQPTDLKFIRAKINNNDLFRDSDVSKLNLDELVLNQIDLMEGETLYNQGDSANSIYLVADGEINLITKKSSNKTGIVISKNKFFGHNEYFLNTERNSTAVALKDSQIIELSKDNIELILKQHNSLLNNLKKLIISQSVSDNDTLENIPIVELESCENTNQIFQLEVKTKEKPNSNSTKKELSNIRDTESGNEVVQLKILGTGIDNVIKNLNENLSQLEKERNKVQSVISDYENQKKLLDEINILKEKVNQFIKSDKGKNEILGQQSYRIIELEKENIKFKELEKDYRKKIELSFNRDVKDKKLESDLKEKDNIIFKLKNEIEDIKKSIPILNETRIKLLQENEVQEKLIKEQKNNLKTSDQKIEKLISELSEKENHINEIKKDLENKNIIISKQTENEQYINSEIGKLNDSLNNKNELIENLNNKLSELQNQLYKQNENEKISLNKEKELNEKISALQSQLKEVTIELSKVTDQINHKNKIYDELKIERDNLSGEVNKLNKYIEEKNNDDNSSLLNIKEELKKLNIEIENYKISNQEKDSLNEELKTQVIKLKEAKTTVIESLTSAKIKHLEDLKKKDAKISDLLNKLGDIKNLLEEKIFLEKQQSETIDNQAQKIAELNGSINNSNESDSNNNQERDENLLIESEITVDLAADEPQYEDKPDENEIILSKCDFIKSASANEFLQDNSYEHLQYFDIHIINLNLLRATIEAASSFNIFLNDLINDEDNNLIVNLSKCQFVDSSVLGVLVNSLKKARKNKGDLKIVWPTQNESSTFRLASMDNIFQIFSNLKDALNSYSPEQKI